MKMKNGAFFIFELIMKAVTVIIFIPLLLCLIIPSISPDSIGYIQLIGLFAPLIYLLNILALLFWAIRFKRFVIIPLIGLILSIWNIGKIFRLSITTPSNLQVSGVNVMSYNVMGFLDEKYKLHTGETLKWIKEQKVDILCIQEFSTMNKYPFSRINLQLPSMKYNRVFYTRRYNKDYGSGLAIYSTYPIIGRKNFDFKGTNNGAMYVDIKIKRDTIRVFNLHLQTTTITNDERLMLSDKGMITDFDTKGEINKVKNIGKKLKHNNSIRGKQAEMIREEIEKSPYNVIVCGDFNDTPISYTYRKIRGKLNDSFIEQGRGYGHTFNHFFSLLRIDYILHSKGLKALSYSTTESKWSDHNSVMVKFEIGK